MAKIYKGFYAGSGLELEYYNPSSVVFDKSKFIASVSPFVKKALHNGISNLGFSCFLIRI